MKKQNHFFTALTGSLILLKMCSMISASTLDCNVKTDYFSCIVSLLIFSPEKLVSRTAFDQIVSAKGAINFLLKPLFNTISVIEMSANEHRHLRARFRMFSNRIDSRFHGSLGFSCRWGRIDNVSLALELNWRQMRA